MTFPITKSCNITAWFDELRPIGNPHRPHAAWDLGVPTGTQIFAPERGDLLWHIRLRSNREKTHGAVTWPDGKWYAWSNYFYDWAGGVAVLHGRSGYTHVFLHFEANEILSRMAQESHYEVWREDVTEDGDRFWMISTVRTMVPIGEGALIGFSGEAGKITGPHVHYEIHRGKQWIAHGQRTNPAELFPDVANRGGV